MVKLVVPDKKDVIEKLVKIELEVFGDAGLNEWNMIPLVRHGLVFFIEEAAAVIGSAQFIRDWADCRLAYLVGISIDKGYQGRGYGTVLLQESIYCMAEEGIKRIELTVDPDNFAAISVYQRKLGFEIREKREDEYGPGINRLVLEKSLT